MKDLLSMIAQLSGNPFKSNVADVTENEYKPDDTFEQETYPGIYEPQKDYMARVLEAQEFGFAPPKSDSIPDLLEYHQRVWPILEQNDIKSWTNNSYLTDMFLKFRDNINI